MAFSPDGTLLCVGGRSVSLWSVPERRKLWRAHPLSHPASLAFTNDAEHIVVKNTSGLIVQVHASDGDLATGFLVVEQASMRRGGKPQRSANQHSDETATHRLLLVDDVGATVLRPGGLIMAR